MVLGFRVKAQVPSPPHPETHKTLHDLPVPCLPSPPPSLLLAQSASATQASSVLLQHTRHSPASGPLHRLFPLPETTPPALLLWLAFLAYRSQFKTHLIRQPFSDHQIQNSPQHYLTRTPDLWYSQNLSLAGFFICLFPMSSYSKYQILE